MAGQGRLGRVVAFVMAGGEGNRLNPLTAERCKPARPFGAQFRLERLCRYISRPALSEKRLSLTAQGKVRYQLKTPYSDGTTQVAAFAHPCASRH
jgi:hypothetical protein